MEDKSCFKVYLWGSISVLTLSQVIRIFSSWSKEGTFSWEIL